jgi:hypothetical protein
VKRLLAPLALLLTSLLPISAALAAPTDDPNFDRLDQLATDLLRQGQNWDRDCAFPTARRDPMQDNRCRRALEALQGKWKQFIELAGQYHSNGSDCRAILQQRWIQFRIREFTFNLKYTGVRNTARLSEEFALHREGRELQEETKNCMGKQNQPKR